ncbi:MAG: glycosyltransferase family 9 protein [bacterium]
MELMRLFAKKITMAGLGIFLRLYCFAKRGDIKRVETIAVPFLRILGIGDLVMLSPFFAKIRKIFPNAKITLITWTEDFIDFEGVEILQYKEYLKNKRKFDLTISATLNLKHIWFVFLSKSWIGYFTTTKIQSNLKMPRYGYNMKQDHYLLRAIKLIKSLNNQEGNRFENEFTNKQIQYPKLKLQKPDYFDEQLVGKRYLVVGVFLKFIDRMWSLENISVVLKRVCERKYFDRIVFIGDNSQHNRDYANKLISLCDFDRSIILDLTGKNNIQQTCYIIKNCSLFFGLDTGPSHMAYLLAPKTIALFFTVHPKLRIPANNEISSNVAVIYPPELDRENLYNGMSPVPLKKAMENINKIKVDDVMDRVIRIIKN